MSSISQQTWSADTLHRKKPITNLVFNLDQRQYVASYEDIDVIILYVICNTLLTWGLPKLHVVTLCNTRSFYRNLVYHKIWRSFVEILRKSTKYPQAQRRKKFHSKKNYTKWSYLKSWKRRKEQTNIFRNINLK